MSNDIRSLISSTTRAKVPARDTSLKINSEPNSDRVKSTEPKEQVTDNLTSPKQALPFQGEVPSTSSELSKTESIETEVSNPQVELPTTQKMQQLLTELEKLPKIGKRLAIHLEQNIRTELTTYCSEQDITPETFIEATIILLKNHPNLKAEIVGEATSRLRDRKRAGYLRRTISMLEGV